MSTRSEPLLNLEHLFDAVPEALSVAAAIRDREGRILDFRIEFVNLAAALWAGIERSALVGRLAGEVLPGLRGSGIFEDLRAVVETGKPLSRSQIEYTDAVAGGNATEGVYDLRAIRFGDGYISTWHPTEGPRAPA